MCNDIIYSLVILDKNGRNVFYVNRNVIDEEYTPVRLFWFTKALQTIKKWLSAKHSAIFL